MDCFKLPVKKEIVRDTYKLFTLYSDYHRDSFARSVQIHKLINLPWLLENEFIRLKEE